MFFSIRTAALGASAAAIAFVAVATTAQPWRVDAAPGDTDSTFVPITNCRLADTRPDTRVGVADSLTAEETQTFAAHGANGQCTVPADAVGLSLNVTAVDATAPTFLTIWPEGPLPVASSLNPVPGQPATPNAVTTKLAADGSFAVFNLDGQVDVIIDVNGYFTDTSLDELDQRVAAVESRIVPFHVQLSVGERVAIASNGPISFEADCTQSDDDIEARVLATTTENDDVIVGSDSFDFAGGSDGFLLTDTDADVREIASISEPPGSTEVGQDIDSGYILTASGEYLAIDTETLALGVNYAGSDCIFAGTATSFTAG